MAEMEAKQNRISEERMRNLSLVYGRGSVEYNKGMIIAEDYRKKAESLMIEAVNCRKKVQLISTTTPTSDMVTPRHENTTTISVIVSGECRCGSHAGSLESSYNGQNVSIDFSHNPTPGNPVNHPIIVLKNNELVKGWDSLLCSIGSDRCPILGSKIMVLGRWTNKESFDAYKILIK